MAKAASMYAQKMGKLAARIFDEVTLKHDPKTMRVVQMFSEKPVYKRPEVTQYYPEYQKLDRLMSFLSYHGLYRDEHEDFKQEMARKRRLRGKGPPQKGEGRRSKTR